MRIASVCLLDAIGLVGQPILAVAMARRAI